MESSNGSAASKTQAVIRCAKSALLLTSLKKSFPNARREDEEKEILLREVAELKVMVARERLKTDSIKLCGLIESLLLLAVAVLSVWISFSFMP